MSAVATGSQLLARATRTLNAADVPDAGRDARRLLAHVLRVPAGRLTLFLPEPVEADLAANFDALIERRALRVPVSHLTGRRLFYGREFLVTPEVLDPRPETETLIEAALAEPFERVLDLGTGSGCIVLTLVSEMAGSIGVGTDLSDAALNVAFWNRNALKLESRVSLVQGSWFDPITGQAPFDLIVSNPPYIAMDEMPGLSPEVREFEPHLALTDGGDGLLCHAAICRAAPAHLAPGGRLMIEIGPTQARDVCDMMTRAGLTDLRVIADLDGRDRVVLGINPRK
ncbi:peptide chain release factor N(5)-glutamine methyltransferase [Puniceibacterium sp. IMCC21224]|uniref:peptide chain release factor N(5)-glutamine methyltransferase n=1 Tax=Puniceibacterium sp. IMCC21224 TaxID=1618204 RepID=UPI00064DD443|nr:peptide chain release factor N(5)-glutamine methyltransferase [Puniceibacterium sp. IMCC21224]KMK67027.1 (protein release factor)-glutamine N5-methyltransferase [Puniceibacterium sp. IMCC21224]